MAVGRDRIVRDAAAGGHLRAVPQHGIRHRTAFRRSMAGVHRSRADRACRLRTAQMRAARDAPIARVIAGRALHATYSAAALDWVQFRAAAHFARRY